MPKAAGNRNDACRKRIVPPSPPAMAAPANTNADISATPHHTKNTNSIVLLMGNARGAGAMSPRIPPTIASTLKVRSAR